MDLYTIISELRKELAEVKESRAMYYKSLYFLIKRLGGKVTVLDSDMISTHNWRDIDIIIYPNDTLDGTVLEIIEGRDKNGSKEV